MLGFLFFFSSRRRHTRYIGDWSSDVCSSDLLEALNAGGAREIDLRHATEGDSVDDLVFAELRPRQDQLGSFGEAHGAHHLNRSEERRVGKECRYRWSA